MFILRQRILEILVVTYGKAARHVNSYGGRGGSAAAEQLVSWTTHSFKGDEENADPSGAASHSHLPGEVVAPLFRLPLPITIPFAPRPKPTHPPIQVAGTI